MSARFIPLFLWLAAAAFAKDLVVEVTEITWKPIPGVPLTERLQTTRSTARYVINLNDFSLATFEGVHGGRLAPINKFKIEPVKSDMMGMGYTDLCRGDQHLLSAQNILYQCTADARDIVIIRKEHNSFSNPVRWFVALSGHPVQVSEIWAVVLDAGLKVKEIRLLSKPASYEWESAVFEKEPNQVPEPTSGLAPGRGSS